MSASHSVTASEAKLRFGDVLGRCIYGGEEVVITKHDKPVAVLVRMEEWRKLRGSGDADSRPETPWIDRPDRDLPPVLRRIRNLHNRIFEYRKRHGIRKKVDAVKLIRMIRDEDDDE